MSELQPSVLRTWGEIALYLNCSIDTARNYLRFGLPVRKGMGMKRRDGRRSNAVVFARARDLDRWLNSQERLSSRPARVG